MNYFVKPWITDRPYVGVSGLGTVPAPSPMWARIGLVQRPMVGPDTGSSQTVFTNGAVPSPQPTQGAPIPVTAGLSQLPMWAYALGALGLWYAFARR